MQGFVRATGPRRACSGATGRRCSSTCGRQTGRRTAAATNSCDSAAPSAFRARRAHLQPTCALIGPTLVGGETVPCLAAGGASSRRAAGIENGSVSKQAVCCGAPLLQRRPCQTTAPAASIVCVCVCLLISKRARANHSSRVFIYAFRVISCRCHLHSLRASAVCFGLFAGRWLRLPKRPLRWKVFARSRKRPKCKWKLTDPFQSLGHFCLPSTRVRRPSDGQATTQSAWPTAIGCVRVCCFTRAKPNAVGAANEASDAVESQTEERSRPNRLSLCVCVCLYISLGARS